MRDHTTDHETDSTEFEFGSPQANSDPRTAPESGSSVIDRVIEQVSSRRQFMGAAAKVGGGALALSAGTDAAFAQSDDSDNGNGKAKTGGNGKAKSGGGGGGTNGGGGGNNAASGGPSDLTVLNFALTLERLEYAFYQDALASSGGMFSEHDAERSANAKNFAEPALRYSTYQQFEQIRHDEKEHVELLETAIERVGGTPVKKADYTFPDYENFEQFAELAKTFEAIGTAAYTRGADLLSNTDYLAQAARILAVEARHESYLREINVQIGFPYAFQPTMTVAEIKAEIAPFIKGMSSSSGLTKGQQTTMIEEGSGDHTIRLSAKIPGWTGVAPDSINGEINPTLTLQKGETYDITWKEAGDAAHELLITDASGNILGASGDAEEKGETRTVSIKATEDVANYHCDFHPLTMHGTIKVTG